MRPQERSLAAAAVSWDDARICCASVDPAVWCAACRPLTGRVSGSTAQTRGASSALRFAAAQSAHGQVRRQRGCAACDCSLQHHVGHLRYAKLWSIEHLFGVSGACCWPRSSLFCSCTVVQVHTCCDDYATNAVSHAVLLPAGYSTGMQDGPGLSAKFSGPRGICLDYQGNLWVADRGNSCIRCGCTQHTTQHAATPAACTAACCRTLVAT